MYNNIRMNMKLNFDKKTFKRFKAIRTKRNFSIKEFTRRAILREIERLERLEQMEEPII